MFPFWPFFMAHHRMKENGEDYTIVMFFPINFKKKLSFQYFRDIIITIGCFSWCKKMKKHRKGVFCDSQISASYLEACQDVNLSQFWLGEWSTKTTWGILTCSAAHISWQQSLHQWFLWYPFLKLAAEKALPLSRSLLVKLSSISWLIILS